MEIKDIYSSEFKKYGCVLKGYNFEEIITKMNEIKLSEEVLYIPSVKELEDTEVFEELRCREYGEMEIQAGYCMGFNEDHNTVEYHRDSEINIAASDMILWLGHREDVKEDGTYDFEKLEPFYLPKGAAIECFSQTLHYAPCSYESEGFKCIVVLPKGTNEPLENKVNFKNAEDRLLTARNKWVIYNR